LAEIHFLKNFADVFAMDDARSCGYIAITVIEPTGQPSMSAIA
jgi:hypothetical protein